MLTITSHAVEAIRTLVGPDEGVRISLAPAAFDGGGPGLTVEAVPAPQHDDAVIETDGVELYVEEEALELLEDKVLDADEEGDAIRFSVHE